MKNLLIISWKCSICILLFLSGVVSAQSKEVKIKNNSGIMLYVKLGRHPNESDFGSKFLTSSQQRTVYIERSYRGDCHVTITPISGKKYNLIRRVIEIREERNEYDVEIKKEDIGVGEEVPQYWNNIAGKWRRQDGLIVEFQGVGEFADYSELYEGRIIELSSKMENDGFKTSQYLIDVRRRGCNFYIGSMISSTSAFCDLVGEVFIVVNGDTMEGGGTWQRVAPFPTGEIAGYWLHPKNGYQLEFVQDGTKVTGTILYRSRDYKDLGYIKGENIFELSETSPYVYTGKMKIRDGLSEPRWEEVIMRAYGILMETSIGRMQRTDRIWDEPPD